ncbi:MAG: DNA-binding NarL/FixJ family response regulator [Cyclobacteriaceae bacterium]|jgi:DNA-binding NarL/FixJ family response regulator
MKTRKILIMIVDDHSMIRKTLTKLLLKEIADCTVVEAESSEEAIQKLHEALNPDLIIMDISMPGMGGIEACRIITNCFPDSNVIILSLNEEQPYINQGMAYGASAFVNKTSSKKKLLHTIRDQLKLIHI